MRRPLCLGVLLIVACDGRPEGAACTEGGDCEDGLACFLDTLQPATGTCTKPRQCGDDLDCDCVQSLGAECAGGSVNCQGIDNAFTLSCAFNPRQLEGEVCLRGQECVAGLFCRVEHQSESGTCMPVPTTCDGQAICDCLDSVCDYVECDWSPDGIVTLVCR